MKHFLTFFTLLFSLAGHTQQPLGEWADLKWADWLEYDIKNNDFFGHLRERHIVSPQMSWKEISTSIDRQGMTHERFQQFYQGIPIVGYEYILHITENGKLKNSNGDIIPELDISIQDFISENEALRLAMDFIDADQYIWKRNQPTFGRYPSMPVGELVIVDKAYPRFSENFVLAWAFDIYATKPHSRKMVYINAWNGEVVTSINLLHVCGVDVGTGQTIYYGERELQTTSTDSGFILKDDSRGMGIITRSIEEKHFVDDDNYWEEGTSLQKNGVLDVHFGVGATYDFLKDQYGRDGIDGIGSPINAFVYVDADLNNAYWDGESIFFGDGDDVNYGPFAALDICAHEFIHGVTEHTSGLVYAYEPGALNEGFSDLIGKAVEYAYDEDDFSWELSKVIQLGPNAGLRNMENPHKYGNPKYYKGLHWSDDVFDNGGVHTNSGVLNYWYYLLSEGVQDVNEVGYDFSVEKLGVLETAEIAYYAFTNYLTSTASYLDARLATMEVAKELYGDTCSWQYQAIASAWEAVGVGSSVREGDVSIFDYKMQSKVCKSKELQVRMRVMNNSCYTTIVAGESIRLGYAVVGFDTIFDEVIVLKNDFLPGQYFDYTYITLLPLQGAKTYEVDLFVNHENDNYKLNDKRRIKYTQSEDIDYDLELLFAKFQNESCAPKDSTPVDMLLRNGGCSTIRKGRQLNIRLVLDSVSYYTNVRLEQDVFADAFFRVEAIFEPLPRLADEAMIKVRYTPDVIEDNNEVSTPYLSLEHSGVGYFEGFNQFAFDSSLMSVGPVVNPLEYRGRNNIQLLSSQEVMVMSGGNPRGIWSPEDVPWSDFKLNNQSYVTKMDVCYNSDGWINPVLVFDMIQQRSSYDYASLEVNPEWANTMSLFLSQGKDRNEKARFRNVTKDKEWTTYTLGLPVNRGPVNIEFEALLISGESGINGEIVTEDQDLIFLDNIKIVESTATRKMVEQDFEIYPNPVGDELNLELDNIDQNLIEHLKISTLTGETLSTFKFSAQQDVSFLMPGAYMVILKLQNGRSMFRRFIKL